MKFYRHIMAMAVAVCLIAPESAHAVEQLPLPEPALEKANIVIAQFAATPSAPRANECATLLKENYDRIGAIKAYRECRAEAALQQIAAGRWQKAGGQSPN